MATNEEIYDAIRNAGKAGDAEAVRRLTAYLETQQAAPQVAKPAQTAPPVEPPDAPGDGRAALGRGVVAGLETGAHLLSGAVAAPLAGLNAMGAGLINMGARAIGAGEPYNAADLGEATQDTLTYKPMTEAGKKAADIVTKPLQWLDKGADAAGEAVSAATGDTVGPILGTTVKTGLEALPMLLDPMVRARVAPRNSQPVPAPEPQSRPTTATMNPEQAHAAAVETLLAHDVPLSTGQRGLSTLNKQAGSLERAADTVLGKSELVKRQGEAFTRAVSRMIGEDAARLTPEVMQRINNATDHVYETILERTPTRVDRQLIQDLQDFRRQVGGELPASEAAPFLAKIDDIVNQVQAGAPDQPLTIDGRAAQNQRASLTRMQNSPNGSVKHMAGQLKDILDDAFERSATPEDAAAMQAVRSKVQKVKQIEQAINEEGIISPAKLNSILNQKANKGQMKYGRGDQRLVELTKAAKQVLPEKIGNSGTTPRAADVMKVVRAVTHPVRAAVEMGALGAGRLFERGAERGTLTDIRGQNAAAMAPARPYLEALGAATTANASTPEEQRRKMMAEIIQNMGAN